MDFFQFLPTYLLVIINFSTVAYLFYLYIQTRNKVISLLMLSLFFFLGSNVMRLIGAPGGNPNGPPSFDSFYRQFSSTLYSFMFLIVALLLLIFFFQAFRQDTIYTGRNILHIVVTVALFVLAQLNLVYLAVVANDYPDFINTITHPNNTNLPSFVTDIFLTTTLSMAIVFLYSIFLLFVFLHEVRTSLNGISNPKLKPIATKMKYSIYLIILSALFNGPNFMIFGHIMSFVFVISIVLFIYFYRQGGLFFLQGDDIKRLIIMNNAGIPIYSYSFRSFVHKEEQSLSQQENEEILFSGALKSISMLLSEFAGGQQAVTEIRLEELIMNVESFANQCSVVLMVERTSPFIQEALPKFVDRISDLMMEISVEQSFSTAHIKYTNQLVETVFGQSLVMT